MKYLELFWLHFKKAGRIIGDFVSGIVLVVFYCTIFALFAIPFRLAQGPFAPAGKNSNWIPKKQNLRGLEDLEKE